MTLQMNVSKNDVLTITSLFQRFKSTLMTQIFRGMYYDRYEEPVCEFLAVRDGLAQSPTQTMLQNGHNQRTEVTRDVEET